MEIAVCIATCARPKGLRRLIESLASLEFESARPDLRLVVVDNDPESSGEAVVKVIDSLEPRWRGKVEYVAEPRRGISFARNTAIEHAQGADLLAFIDDDESPAPDWLEKLLLMQAQTDANIVTGPVIPRFLDPPPDWAVRGSFFEPEHYSNGTELHVAYTCNALVRREVFDGGLRFDERFALSGGEDSLLFRQAHRAGHRIVWAKDAIVYEHLAPSRVTPSWVLRRGYSIGSRMARFNDVLEPGLATRLNTLWSGTLRVVRGSIKLPFYAFGPKHRQVAALETVAAGLGRLTALFGLRYREYDHIHGD